MFPLVQLATRTVGDMRPAVIRTRYGRRGRAEDPEYGIKNLLVKSLEHLTPAQFDKIMNRLPADRHGQQIAAAWIAKEKLRGALNRATASASPAPAPAAAAAEQSHTTSPKQDHQE